VLLLLDFRYFKAIRCLNVVASFYKRLFQLLQRGDKLTAWKDPFYRYCNPRPGRGARLHRVRHGQSSYNVRADPLVREKSTSTMDDRVRE
jgi:hypothetical protein